MRMDRKWIVVAALMALLLVTACAKKPEPVVTPPPQTTEVAPVTEVPADTAPAEPVDTVEEPPPLTIRQLQEKYESQGLIGDVFYDFDKYDLRPDARERLAKNADFMKSAEGRGLRFTIEGHCDERGTVEYNLALGERRAKAVRDYLVTLGVPASQMRITSYGESRPFAYGHNEDAWAQNRRGHFARP